MQRLLFYNTDSKQGILDDNGITYFNILKDIYREHLLTSNNIINIIANFISTEYLMSIYPFNYNTVIVVYLDMIVLYNIGDRMVVDNTLYSVNAGKHVYYRNRDTGASYILQHNKDIFNMIEICGIDDLLKVHRFPLTNITEYSMVSVRDQLYIVALYGESLGIFEYPSMIKTLEIEAEYSFTNYHVFSIEDRLCIIVTDERVPNYDRDEDENDRIIYEYLFIYDQNGEQLLKVGNFIYDKIQVFNDTLYFIVDGNTTYITSFRYDPNNEYEKSEEHNANNVFKYIFTIELSSTTKEYKMISSSLFMIIDDDDNLSIYDIRSDSKIIEHKIVTNHYRNQGIFVLSVDRFVYNSTLYIIDYNNHIIRQDKSNIKYPQFKIPYFDIPCISGKIQDIIFNFT